MFARFKTPEGQPVHVREKRVQAFVRTEDGQTRLFLGGSLTVLVAEDDEEVRLILAGRPDESETR